MIKDKLTTGQLKVIARIQNSIPKQWLDNVTVTKQKYSTTNEIIDKALADPDVSEEVKAQCRMVRDSGFLDKEVTTDVPKYAKLIEAYVLREIKKAVKRGELPKNYDKKTKN